MKTIKSLMMKMPMMLSCREFEKSIGDYFERDLSTYARLKFYLHMTMCSACKSYINAYRRTIELARKSFLENGEPVPPGDIPKELAESILRASSPNNS